MKQVKWKFPLRSFAVAGSLLLSAVAFAQSGGLKGQVKDATGEPIIGATIMANGKAVGVTDFDGNYVINVPKGTELTITYVRPLQNSSYNLSFLNIFCTFIV